MTGEISLRGRVLPIGGLKEKTMAAYTHHMKTVVIPADNEPDLAEIDEVVRDKIHFVSADHLDTVLRTALVSSPDTGLPAENGPHPPVISSPLGEAPAVCRTQ